MCDRLQNGRVNSPRLAQGEQTKLREMVIEYGKPNKDQIDCGFVLVGWRARLGYYTLTPFLFSRLTGITSVTVTVTVTSITGRRPPSFYL